MSFSYRQNNMFPRLRIRHLRSFPRSSCRLAMSTCHGHSSCYFRTCLCNKKSCMTKFLFQDHAGSPLANRPHSDIHPNWWKYQTHRPYPIANHLHTCHPLGVSGDRTLRAYHGQTVPHKQNRLHTGSYPLHADRSPDHSVSSCIWTLPCTDHPYHLYHWIGTIGEICSIAATSLRVTLEVYLATCCCCRR